MNKITAKMLHAAYNQAYSEIVKPMVLADFPPKTWEETNAANKRAYKIMADILNKQLPAVQPLLIEDEDAS